MSDTQQKTVRYCRVEPVYAMATNDGHTPRQDIASISVRYGLTPNESKSLYAVLDDWPEEQVAEGIAEELANILAMRRISWLPQMTSASFTSTPIAQARARAS